MNSNQNVNSEVDGKLIKDQVNEQAEASKDPNLHEEMNEQVKENKEFHEHTEEKMNDALNDAAYGNGTDGSGTPSPSRTVKTGKPKVFSTGNGIPHESVGFERIGQEEYIVSSDLDKYDKDTNMKAASYEKIAAKIVHESTKQIEDGADSIIGNPGQTSVYSLISDVAQRVISNENTKEPLQSPRHSRIGTKFDIGATIHNNLGSYKANLDDVDKGFANKPSNDASKRKYGNSVVFNRLDTKGKVMPNKFIMPKTGKYLLLGINPFGATSNAANLVKLGSSYNKLNQINGKLAEVEYYQSQIGSNNNLFKVIDVTNVYEAITNATKEAAEELTCLKSKMQFGMYERIADILQEVKTMTPSDDVDASTMPEWYYEGNRSTLWFGELSYAINGSSNYTLACGNNPTQFVRFMEALRSSETMWAMAGLNTINGTNSVLWGKGQTGKTKDPFFRQYSGYCFKTDKLGHYTDNEATSIKLPNMVPYMRSLMSARGFQRGGNVAYQVRELQAKITAMKALLTENSSMKALLEKVGMMDEEVTKLNNALAYGRVVSEDGMNSNANLKLPDNIDIVLDFDPNDLIQCEVSADAPYDIKWLPAAGYMNLVVDDNVNTGPKFTYHVLPTWLETWIKYFNEADEWRKVVCYDLTSADRPWYEAWSRFATYAAKNKSGDGGKTNDTNAKCLLYWLMYGWNTSTSDFTANSSKWESPTGKKRYIPIQVNPFTGSLWAYLLLDSFLLCSNITFGASQNKNAYLRRYLPFLSYNTLTNTTIQEYWDTNAYTFIKSALDNEAFKVNPKYQQPSEYPMLFGEAREAFLDKADNVIARTKVTYFDNKGDNSKTQVDAACYQPTKFLRRKQNLKGITLYTLDTNTTVLTVPKIEKGEFPFNTVKTGTSSLIGPGALHTAISAETKLADLSQATDKITPYNASGFAIYQNVYAKIGSDDVGIKEMENTIPRTNFGADDEYLHYTDDYGKELYGKDHFLLPNSDYLVAAEDNGLYPDASQPETFDYADIMFLPVDEINDFITATSGNRVVRVLSHGKINAVQETVTIDGVEKTITINNPCPGYTLDGTLFAKNAYRHLIRPSLYGYQSDVILGALTLTPDLSGRQGLDRTISSSGKVPARYANICYGVLPKIYGAEVVDHEWILPTAPRDELDACIGDAKYYYCQDMFVGDPDGTYCGDATEYKIDQFYDLGNWVTKCFILHRVFADELIELPRIISIAMNDERLRLIDYYHIGKLLECNLRENDAYGDTESIHMDADFIYSDEVLSKFNFNDVTTYLIGKPVYELDRLWKTHSNMTSLIYEQYVKGK